MKVKIRKILHCANELGLFPRRRAFGHFFQTFNVNYTDNGRRDINRKSKKRRNQNQNGGEKQIQMITVAFFKFVFFSIYDHDCDLLVHGDQNAEQNCGKYRGQRNPPMGQINWIYEPRTTMLCWLKISNLNSFKNKEINPMGQIDWIYWVEQINWIHEQSFFLVY